MLVPQRRASWGGNGDGGFSLDSLINALERLRDNIENALIGC